MTTMIVFYTTGSKKEGLGHVSRVISLIQVLKKRNSSTRALSMMIVP